MNAADLPPWVALLVAVLVVTGAAITLVGSLGLLRLDSFYARVHAPTLGATLGTGCVLIGSMIYFSTLQGRPLVHEMLIAVFVTLTTPVTLMLLARAALYRDHVDGSTEVPPLEAPSSSPVEQAPVQRAAVDAETPRGA